MNILSPEPRPWTKLSLVVWGVCATTVREWVVAPHQRPHKGCLIESVSENSALTTESS